jgi:hypothetical protein
MIDPWLLIVNALAVYRLTRLVTDDELTDPLRTWVFKHRGETAQYFVTCPWCVSVWFAFAVVLLNIWVPLVWMPIAVALALAAMAGFLFMIFRD